MGSPFDATPLRATPYEFQFQAAGLVFNSWYEEEDLPAGASRYLEFRNVGTNLIHVLEMSLRGNATKFRLSIYENASFTAGTVPMEASCLNHIIDSVPSLQGYQNPADVDLQGSTKRDDSLIFGPAQGGQNTASSKPPGLFLERLWSPTDYLVEITNLDGVARDLFFEIIWYESSN